MAPRTRLHCWMLVHRKSEDGELEVDLELELELDSELELELEVQLTS